MTPSSADPTLFMQDGNRLVRIRLSEFADRLGLPPDQVLRLLRGGQTVDSIAATPREGGWGEGARYERQNDRKDIYQTFRYRAATENEAGTGLAHELAAALQDEANLAAFVALTRRYPHWLLMEALRRTLAIPDERIRKSRGALFTAIVRILAREHDQGTSPT